MHFTPTSGSWMKLVERFFRDLTEEVVQEGSFISIDELVQAVMGYLGERNLNPKPYVWKKKGEEDAGAQHGEMRVNPRPKNYS